MQRPNLVDLLQNLQLNAALRSATVIFLQSFDKQGLVRHWFWCY